jgi:hypothetical protein
MKSESMGWLWGTVLWFICASVCVIFFWQMSEGYNMPWLDIWPTIIQAGLIYLLMYILPAALAMVAIAVFVGLLIRIAKTAAQR